MSAVIEFDTHRFVKRLMEGGFTETQAEILADEQVALLNANLATKEDFARLAASVEKQGQETQSSIEALRQETQSGIDALRQETKAGIEALRQETKAGIDALRQETKAGIDALRQETKAEIARIEGRMEAIKSELLKWLFGALIAQSGLLITFLKLG